MATAALAAAASQSEKEQPPPPTSADDVEMSTIQPNSSPASAAASLSEAIAPQPQPQSQPQSPSQPQQRPEAEAEAEADTTAGASPTNPALIPEPPSPSQPKLTRLQSEAGLGPATESPIVPPLPTGDRGPVLSITLMLTTGARHPYKIDEKYLRSRKVEDVGSEGSKGSFDPREISGYKLKELIWTDWRSEWEPRPASPSSIRLIILGRLVEDKAALKDFPFKLDQANVVHMTVKPADFLDDDDTGGKGTGKGHSIRGRDDGERGAGCRCVIL